MKGLDTPRMKRVVSLIRAEFAREQSIAEWVKLLSKEDHSAREGP